MQNQPRCLLPADAGVTGVSPPPLATVTSPFTEVSSLPLYCANKGLEPFVSAKKTSPTMIELPEVALHKTGQASPPVLSVCPLFGA